MDFNAVPANLKKQMVLHGYSMEHLAAMCGMSERTLYNRFLHPGKFTLDELLGLSKHLKITFEQLLTA